MPIAGVVVSETGERFTIRGAIEKGLITNGQGVALLEAQAACGYIVHGLDGSCIPRVDDAIEKGLIPERRQEIIKRAEKAIRGFKYKDVTDDTEKETTTLFGTIGGDNGGSNKTLIPTTHILRLLEAQNATGGVIDFRVNHRRTLEDCVKLGYITQEIKDKLEDAKLPELRYNI